MRVMRMGASPLDTLLGQTFAQTVRQMTFYSNMSPPKTYSGDELLSTYRDPSQNPALAALQPTLILDTAFGQIRFAPYGEANPTAWQRNTNIASGVGAAGLLGVLLFGVWLGSGR